MDLRISLTFSVIAEIFSTSTAPSPKISGMFYSNLYHNSTRTPTKVQTPRLFSLLKTYNTAKNSFHSVANSVSVVECA